MEDSNLPQCSDAQSRKRKASLTDPTGEPSEKKPEKPQEDQPNYTPQEQEYREWLARKQGIPVEQVQIRRFAWRPPPIETPKAPIEKKPEPVYGKLVIGAPYPTVEELIPIPHGEDEEGTYKYLCNIHCGENWNGEMRKKYGHEAFEMWKNLDWKMDDEWYADHTRREWNWRLARGQNLNLAYETKELNSNLKMREKEHDAIRQEWQWMADVRALKEEFDDFTPEEVQKNFEELTEIVDRDLREAEKRARRGQRRGIETRDNTSPWKMYPLANPRIRIPMSVKKAKQARKDARRVARLPDPSPKAVHIPVPIGGPCLECKKDLWTRMRSR